MVMIDAHAHVEMFKGKIPEVVEESRKRLKLIVDSITEYRKFHVWKSWDALKPYFGFIQPTLGYAPNEARRGNWEKVKRVEGFIREHAGEIVAIGEIGLDFYYARTEAERRNQREIFAHFLGLAVELELPVVLHARDAEKEVFEAIEKAGVKAYFHSYSGPEELALEIVRAGHFVGINTGIDFIPEVRKAAEVVPLENILVETDSPYMSPYKGQKNYPWNVEYAIRRIAELRALTFEEVERITEENVLRFFELG